MSKVVSMNENGEPIMIGPKDQRVPMTPEQVQMAIANIERDNETGKAIYGEYSDTACEDCSGRGWVKILPPGFPCALVHPCACATAKKIAENQASGDQVAESAPAVES